MEVGGDKNDEETYTPIAVKSFDDVLEKNRILGMVPGHIVHAELLERIHPWSPE